MPIRTEPIGSIPRPFRPHSADVDYAYLLPSLFGLRVGNVYIALAGEKDRVRALQLIKAHMKPHHQVLVGVVAPIDPRIETARKSGTARSKPRNTSRSSNSVPPTIVGSRRSATIPPRAAMRLSQRFGHAWPAPRWLLKPSE